MWEEPFSVHLVVCLSQRGDHFPLDEAAAVGAAGSEVCLVALGAEVGAVAREEAALAEVGAAALAVEAVRVEKVVAAHAENLRAFRSVSQTSDTFCFHP